MGNAGSRRKLDPCAPKHSVNNSYVLTLDAFVSETVTKADVRRALLRNLTAALRTEFHEAYVSGVDVGDGVIVCVVRVSGVGEVPAHAVALAIIELIFLQQKSYGGWPHARSAAAVNAFRVRTAQVLIEGELVRGDSRTSGVNELRRLVKDAAPPRIPRAVRMRSKGRDGKVWVSVRSSPGRFKWTRP